MDISSVILTVLGAVGGVVLKTAYDSLVSGVIKKPEEVTYDREKKIVEKRLSAYEEIIVIVGQAGRRAPKNRECSSIFYDISTYNKWLDKFFTIYDKTMHLTDNELGLKLWIFYNYIFEVNSLYVSRIREIVDSSDNTEQITQEKLHAIGCIIFDDLQNLTRDILGEASKLFRTDMPVKTFIPSTISISQYVLPNEFAGLALYRKEKELKKISGDDK